MTINNNSCDHTSNKIIKKIMIFEGIKIKCIECNSFLGYSKYYIFLLNLFLFVAFVFSIVLSIIYKNILFYLIVFFVYFLTRLFVVYFLNLIEKDNNKNIYSYFIFTILLLIIIYYF
jgi:hypothetical protein